MDNINRWIDEAISSLENAYGNDISDMDDYQKYLVKAICDYNKKRTVRTK